jgi:hypothetical protein
LVHVFEQQLWWAVQAAPVSPQVAYAHVPAKHNREQHSPTVAQLSPTFLQAATHWPAAQLFEQQSSLVAQLEPSWPLKQNVLTSRKSAHLPVLVLQKPEQQSSPIVQLTPIAEHA